MPDSIESYFVRELEYLRRKAAEFASEPENRFAAERLYFDGQGSSTDPHVRWLLEGVAHLNARIHRRLDDDFPQFTEALLDQLYPAFLRPIPAMTVAEFDADPQLIPPETGLSIAAGTPISTTYSLEGLPRSAYFQTCYDITLWPLSVEEVVFRSARRIRPELPGSFENALVITVRSTVPLNVLGIDSLDFHVSGDAQWTPAFYELLCRSYGTYTGHQGDSRGASPWLESGQKLQPLGFSPGESLLPDPPRFFNEYRLLQEYFLLPEKFLFFRCSGLRNAFPGATGNVLRIVIALPELERHELQETIQLAASSPKAVRLGCSPVVNLFRKSIAIRYDRRRTEYLIDDGTSPRTPVFAVHSVEAQRFGSGVARVLKPLYAPRVRSEKTESDITWYLARSSTQADERDQVYLCLRDPLANLDSKPEILSLDCACSNGAIGSRLFVTRKDGRESDFEIELAGIRKITALRNPPAPSLTAPGPEKGLWELISLLSLNYLSIVEDGKESLQRILLLNAFRDTAQNRRQVQAISAVRHHAAFAPVRSGNGIAYARGLVVEIDIDEQDFPTDSPYLFANVLERFLGSYVSLNSFSQLVISLNHGERRIEWPPRAGQRVLL